MAPCTIATKMLAAGGAELTGGCAFTVLTAISFHLVTSFAEATVGMASAMAATNAMTQANRVCFTVFPTFGLSWSNSNWQPGSGAGVKCQRRTRVVAGVSRRHGAPATDIPRDALPRSSDDRTTV